MTDVRRTDVCREGDRGNGFGGIEGVGGSSGKGGRHCSSDLIYICTY